jgi:hypothetical protein
MKLLPRDINSFTYIVSTTFLIVNQYRAWFEGGAQNRQEEGWEVNVDLPDGI